MHCMTKCHEKNWKRSGLNRTAPVRWALGESIKRSVWERVPYSSSPVFFFLGGGLFHDFWLLYRHLSRMTLLMLKHCLKIKLIVFGVAGG